MRALTPLTSHQTVTDVATVVLPHAGGSPRAFRHWEGEFSDRQLWGVTYPGRDHRIADRPYGDLVTTAEEVATEITALDPQPRTVVLVGHSMGAWAAYEVAVALAAAPPPTPQIQLVVSGQNPPHLTPGTRLHTAPDELLVADIVRQNPQSAEVWAVPELRSTFLPAVRDDYRLLETYRPSAPPAPPPWTVTVVVGSTDREVDHRALFQWDRYSSTPARIITLPGGHFYLAAPDVSLARIARQSVNFQDCLDSLK